MLKVEIEHGFEISIVKVYEPGEEAPTTAAFWGFDAVERANEYAKWRQEGADDELAGKRDEEQQPACFAASGKRDA